ncbi:hypothetical protein PybrP1_005297 [[Pythium] brassicae (nom. inval.)]|nr:hypothetical protein PybrP1_005297 [[Pythium] brassicae (nom. inval.)]
MNTSPPTATSKKKRIVLQRYVPPPPSSPQQQCQYADQQTTLRSTGTRKRGGGERLNDAQRLEIIRLRRQTDAPSLRSVASAFNVSERSIRNVMLSAAVIEQRTAHTDLQCQLRTFRSAAPRFPELEERVIEWLQALREIHINPAPSAVIEKAKAVAGDLGIAGFKGSPGWFERFRKRRRLVDRPRVTIGGYDSEVKIGELDHVESEEEAVEEAVGSDVHEPELHPPGEPTVLPSVFPQPQPSAVEDATNVQTLLRQLADLESKLRAFQHAHPLECGRLQQCLANATVIRHDLLAVHANMQVRSMRATAGFGDVDVDVQPPPLPELA